MSCTAFPTRSGWRQSNSSIFTQYFLYLYILLGGQVSFQQTDTDLAIYEKIFLMKKTYQFVSYVQEISKPKKQEEIVLITQKLLIRERSLQLEEILKYL